MKSLNIQNIHYNRFQFDLKFEYLLESGVNRKRIFQIDTFFFLPNNMGITPENYSKEMFFSGLQRYLKYKISIDSYRDIIDGPCSPLRQFELALAELGRRYTPENCKKYATLLRIFCSVMRTAAIDEPLAGGISTCNAVSNYDDSLRQIRGIISRFRLLKETSAFSGLHPEEQKYYSYADEFLSLCLNEFLCKQWRRLEKIAVRENLNEARSSLWNLMREEQHYRFQNHYRSAVQGDTKKSDRLYWERILKKTMASVLFLRPQRQRNGIFIENFFFCISAGIAMIFATGVAFAWKGLYLEEFSFSFFAIWVFAYMGKDRIKELLRYYFQNRLRHYIHDYKTVVKDAFGNPVGCSLESMMFVENEQKLEPAILRTRNRSHITELEHDNYKEHVIAFRKQVEFSLPENLSRYHLGINKVIDSTRYNIGGFLSKLDEPLKKILFPSDSGTMTEEEVTRIYHLNAVIRYGEKNRECNYLKLRFILSRDGIRRMILFPDDKERGLL